MKKKLPLLIISILILFLLIILFLPGKTIEFNIEDRCGPIVNMISHTINDEDSCINKCKSQCETKDNSYKKVKFELNELGCNECSCICSEKWI